MWRPGSSIGRTGGQADGSVIPRKGGNRPDEERRRRVAFDAERKHGARKYTNWGYSPPHTFLHREVMEY